MNLALFDFDGTITNKDTFTDFIHFAVDRKRLMIGKIILSPFILGYKLGVIPAGKTREIIAGFGFRGRKSLDVNSIGLKYCNQMIPKYIRPIALKRIKWHKAQGDKIVVVSASLDVYLRYWCNQYELELICSKFEVKNGQITGKYSYSDCNGKEKARRIKDNYNIEDHQIVYAYGDTAEDKEMLDLADIKFFRWKVLS